MAASFYRQFSLKFLTETTIRLALCCLANYCLSQFLYRPYLINYASDFELLLFQPYFPYFARMESIKLRKLMHLLPPHQEPFPILCHTLAAYIALWFMNETKGDATNNFSNIIKNGLYLALGNFVWTLNAQRISEMHLFFILINFLHSFMANSIVACLMFVKITGNRVKVE